MFSFQEKSAVCARDKESVILHKSCIPDYLEFSVNRRRKWER